MDKTYNTNIQIGIREKEVGYRHNTHLQKERSGKEEG